jgi:hypothetical protein
MLVIGMRCYDFTADIVTNVNSDAAAFLVLSVLTMFVIARNVDKLVDMTIIEPSFSDDSNAYFELCNSVASCCKAEGFTRLVGFNT